MNINKAVAYWNVEHTKRERAAHLREVQEIIKLLGYEDILSAEDVSLPDWDSKPSGMLGFPATRIDVKLAPQYLGKVWRENGTCARVKCLSVIHLVFRLNAGVEDGSPKLDKRPVMKPGDHSVAKALKISRWPGWESTVAEYSMTTDGKQCGYRRRSWYGYCGRGDLGDAFGFSETFDGLRSQLATVFRHVVEGLGMTRYRANLADAKKRAA